MARFTVDELLLNSGSRLSSSSDVEEVVDIADRQSPGPPLASPCELPTSCAQLSSGLNAGAFGAPPLRVVAAATSRGASTLRARPEPASGPFESRGPPTAELYLQLAAALQAARQHASPGNFLSPLFRTGVSKT